MSEAFLSLDLTWLDFLIVLLGSALAGSVNTLAGNGSAITLTILTAVIGLPDNLANGTNRIGVFSQTSLSAWAFYRNGQLRLRRSRLPILLTVLGALGGVAVAVNISNESFRQVFRFLMLFMLIVVLVKPKRWLRETDANFQPTLWLAIPLYLAIGFYGGFIQMGMGVFFLAIMVLFARYSLLEANAVKLFVIGVYTSVVLLIFHLRGLVNWEVGLLMAVGQSIGGYLTAHYASRYEGINVWAHRVLVVVILLAVVHLFWDQLVMVFGG